MGRRDACFALAETPAVGYQLAVGSIHNDFGKLRGFALVAAADVEAIKRRSLVAARLFWLCSSHATSKSSRRSP